MAERGVKPYRIFVYMLVTADIEDAAQRVDALKQLGSLRIYAQAERNDRLGISPKVMRLVVGAKAYGKNKWVITSVSFDMKRLDARGNLLAVGANVALTAYPAR
jgi:hypothetical protein